MTLTSFVNHLPALPEAVLLTGACALMIVDLYVRDARRTATYIGALLVVLATFLASAFVLWAGYAVEEGARAPRYVIFNGLFVADLFSHFLKIVSYLSVAAALVYSRQYLIDRDLMRGEFITLLLFALLGMMLMISANSFLTVYLGLELMSLCLYAMVALNRDSAQSTEAAMKYFVLGALSSGLLLYGMSMVYGATGSLNLDQVARALSTMAASPAERPFLTFGLVFIVAGVAFKIGVAPFHMWIPDVYHGAPTPVTLVIGSAPKLAAFAVGIRLLVNGMLDLAVDWQPMLALCALLSMAIGNITAIAQSNLKRMLAYSTIAQMGFLLLGLLSGVVEGNALNAPEAYGAALFYAVVYLVMSLGAFGMLLYCSRSGFDCENLDDMRGLSRRAPWFALLMMIIMLSLAGLPPTAGFYAKFVVLSAAVSAGYVWLAVAAVVLSLVGAFYYLRIVKLMYFDEARDAAPVTGHVATRVLLSVNGLALLALGILPKGLMEWCLDAINALSEHYASGALVYDGALLKVHRDEVRLPDGGLGVREYIRHPGAVAVVPLFDDGRVLLERQFRYPHKRVFIEVPAGKLEPGEPHLDTAKRELLEETGYTAAEWSRLGIIHTSIAYTDETIELFLARGLQPGKRKLDTGEFLETFAVPFDEAVAMIREGRITDAKSVAALLWVRVFEKTGV